jgi:hypothetical protein
MKRVVFLAVILCMAFGVLASVQSVRAATAAPLTLAWNPANDLSVKGYAIYYGPTNQPATNRLDVGMSNSVTLFNLQANVTYRVYAVSYNAARVESVPSNPVLITQGVVARLKIAKQANGSMKLTFSAAPGTASQVQYASSPVGATWRNLGTTTTDASGNGTMTDTAASQASRRFYRVAVP